MPAQSTIDTLLRQAPMTAKEYLIQAVNDIDEVFEEGYAKAHPVLVAAFIETCAADFNAGLITAYMKDMDDDISAALSDIATALESYNPNNQP